MALAGSGAGRRARTRRGITSDSRVRASRAARRCSVSRPRRIGSGVARGRRAGGVGRAGRDAERHPLRQSGLWLFCEHRFRCHCLISLPDCHGVGTECQSRFTSMILHTRAGASLAFPSRSATWGETDAPSQLRCCTSAGLLQFAAPPGGTAAWLTADRHRARLVKQCLQNPAQPVCSMRLTARPGERRPAGGSRAACSRASRSTPRRRGGGATPRPGRWCRG